MNSNNNVGNSKDDLIGMIQHGAKEVLKIPKEQCWMMTLRKF